jgi:hypothetical protein
VEVKRIIMKRNWGERDKRVKWNNNKVRYTKRRKRRRNKTSELSRR